MADEQEIAVVFAIIENAGLTYRETAILMGIPFSTLQAALQNRRMPTKARTVWRMRQWIKANQSARSRAEIRLVA